jgi:hypothetical protein
MVTVRVDIGFFVVRGALFVMRGQYVSETLLFGRSF